MKRKYCFVDMQGNKITEFETREKFTHLRVGYGLLLETDDYPLSDDTYLRIEGVYRRVTAKRGKFRRDDVLVVCSVQRDPDAQAIPREIRETEAVPYVPASAEILDQVRVRRRPPRHDPLVDGPRRTLDV